MGGNNPYDKAFRISVTLHAAAVAVVVLFAVWNQIFQPHTAAIFTVMAPPGGLIAGGPMSTPSASSGFMPQQGPKLPSPAPAARPAKKAPAPSVIPSDDFLDSTPAKPKAAKKKTSHKTLKQSFKPQLISYSEWLESHPKKSTPHKTSAQPQAQIAPESSLSFEENLSSKLDKRIQEEGQSAVGTGLGGLPGSGAMGSGTPGATEDADTLYSGTLYSYLNSVWEEPKEVGNVHLFANVEFVVDKNGTITEWKITHGSGSDAFDKSVERVFKKIKQVAIPPTPQEYRLSVTFETRDS